MNDEYLWNKTGEPPADVAELERVLGELRLAKDHDPRAGMRNSSRPRSNRIWLYAGLAAALAIVAGAGIASRLAHRLGPATSWQLSLSGAQPRSVRVGELVATNASLAGSLRSEFVGNVEIDPGSELQIMAAGDREQRWSLHHGTIHATIWAPPTRFVVDTPSARAVDLGCQYSLQVDRSGTGLLTVETGWVALAWKGSEAFLPAGAACRTRPGRGPDTPYFLTSSGTFQEALREFDMKRTKQALDKVLAEAHSQDGLSLWHLLQHTNGTERGAIFDRMAMLLPAESKIGKDAVLRGDRQALDASWELLDLGSASWWRQWKRQW